MRSAVLLATATSTLPMLTAASGHVEVSAAGAVAVDSVLWLSAVASPRLFCDGRWVALGDGKLHPTVQGADLLGAFSEQTRTFASTDGGVGVELAVKTYGNDIFVLEQRLRHGCSHTQASPVPVLPQDKVETVDTEHPGTVPPFLSFPAWDTEDGELRSLNFLTWQGGNHAIYQWTVQESHGRDVTAAASDGTFGGLAGLSSGPVVLMKAGPNQTALPTALVIGPISNPKLATSVIPETSWEIGVSSEVRSVPAGFTHRTLLAAAPGPTRAMAKWGALAQREAKLGSRFEDIATTQLGYFTDNGAMLYGDAWGELGQKHGGNLYCCNETVMHRVLRGLNAQRIPYNWIQMDDWWYTGYFPSGGGVFCTHDWTPWPHAFPGGLDAVQTDVPWLLYAPFFCGNSTWAQKDPSRMLVSPGGYAVPTPNSSLDFYRELFAMYKGRIQGYEVDFMIDNFLNQYLFREELGAAEQWLAGMHGAAAESKMSIQYCMALPSDLLASMAFPHVTNYRASDDYAGSSVTNFNLQTSSLLGWAVGLRPSKDVFFTTANEPDNPYMRRLRPTHPTVPGVDLELNALIATLSTGPVAIGDGPFATNRSLLLRSCREDGLLLQPEKPPTAIDAQYDGRRAPQGGLVAAGGAQVWSTYSEVPLQAKAVHSRDAPQRSVLTHHLLSIDVEGPYWIDTRRDLYPGYDNTSDRALYWWHHTLHNCANGSRAIASSCVLSQLPALDDSRRPLLHHRDSHHWSLLHATALLPNGWVFLGELMKWVPTSSRRFTTIDGTSTASGVRVSLTCAHPADGPAEQVEVTALQPIGKSDGVSDQGEWVIRTIGVTCSSDGQASVCIGSC